MVGQMSDSDRGCFFGGHECHDCLMDQYVCDDCGVCTDVRHGPLGDDTHCVMACPLEGGTQLHTQHDRASGTEYTDVSEDDHPTDYYTTVHSDMNGQTPSLGLPHGAPPAQTIVHLQSQCQCGLECPYGGHRCRLGCLFRTSTECNSCRACGCSVDLPRHCVVVCPNNRDRYDGTPRPLAAQVGSTTCVYVYQ